MQAPSDTSWQALWREGIRQRGLPPLREFLWSDNEPVPPESDEASLRKLLEPRETMAWDRVFRVLRGRARNQLVSAPELRKELSADDLAQRTLTRAHRSSAFFRGRTEQQYFSWLFRIQDNLFLDVIRHHHRGDGMAARVRSVDSRVSGWSSNGRVQFADPAQATPSSHARKHEAISRLYEAIDALPDEDRDVIVARMAESTFGQIAEELDIPKTTVLRRYKRGLQTLRHALGDSE